MKNRGSSVNEAQLIAPGSPEELHYAEKGYIIVDGKPVCGVCFEGYDKVHRNWCPYGPGAK